MLDTLKKQWQARLSLTIFIGYSLWWILIQNINPNPQNLILDLFSNTYCLIALLGSIWGISIANHWGGMKSRLGRAIFLLSGGLLAQVFGQISYSYIADIVKIEIPYPSVGDIGYFGSIFFYIFGVIYLARVTGVNFSLKQIENKLQAVIFPLFILGFSYYIFLKDYSIDWNQPVKTILDFGYPLGQAFYISLTLLTFLLSKKYLGGLMKPKILTLLAALLAQYVADFNFLYQTSRQTWTYAGYGDYLYFLAYFLMTLALLQLKTAFEEVRQT